MPSLIAGVTATQLTPTDTPVTYGVQMVADASNAGTVYVGWSNTVTASTASATDGLPLAPGASILVPRSKTANANTLYVIGSIASQKIFFEVF